MFNKIGLTIIKGLLTILPFALTIYFLVWLAMSAEGLLRPHLPQDIYFPGLGVVTMLILLAVVGLLVNAFIVRTIIRYSKNLLEKVPVVKTLFGAIQDAVQLFEVKKDQGNKKAVSVEISEGVQLIGFITNESVAKLLFPEQNKVAVYLPLSYQIGGYTLYIDADKVSKLDIDVETAMRIAVTGGSSIAAAKSGA